MSSTDATLARPDTAYARPLPAVVGSGRMGTAVVRLLAQHGPVRWSGRDPEALEARIQEAGLADRVTAVDHAQAARTAVVFLALWHRDALAFATAHRAALAGRIVVDLANPFTEDLTAYTLPENTSAAEELARLLPGTRIVGALKNTFWVVLEQPAFPEGPSDVLVTGDDQAAKRCVTDLLAPLPFRILDAGALANSRTVERMTLLSREIAIRYGHYPRVTWRLLGDDA